MLSYTVDAPLPCNQFLAIKLVLDALTLLYNFRDLNMQYTANSGAYVCNVEVQGPK
jgi:hypothetical protein